MSRLEGDNLPQRQRRRAATAQVNICVCSLQNYFSLMKKAPLQGWTRWKENSCVMCRGVARLSLYIENMGVGVLMCFGRHWCILGLTSAVHTFEIPLNFSLVMLRQTTSGNQASCSTRLLRKQLRCTLPSVFLLAFYFISFLVVLSFKVSLHQSVMLHLQLSELVHLCSTQTG